MLVKHSPYEFGQTRDNHLQLNIISVSYYTYIGGGDRMVVGVSTTCAINAYHH